MSNRYAAGHRDANEPQIIEVLDAFHVRYLKAREGHGFDLLILVQPVQLWEIKNPEASKSDRGLTECESKMQAHCREQGIPYHVIEQPEQAAEILSEHFSNQASKCVECHEKLATIHVCFDCYEGRELL